MNEKLQIEDFEEKRLLYVQIVSYLPELKRILRRVKEQQARRKKVAREILQSLNPPETKGVEYILQAIELMYIRLEKIRLYETIAQTNGDTLRAVEHSIEWVIQSIWKEANQERLEQLGFLYSEYKPSNVEFSTKILEYIKINEKRGKVKALEVKPIKGITRAQLMATVIRNKETIAEIEKYMPYIIQAMKEEKRNDQNEKAVREIIKSFNVPYSRGMEYLIQAISLRTNTKSAIIELSKQEGRKTSSVNNLIIYMIEEIWREENKEKLESLGFTYSSRRPTNTQFINQIAKAIAN